MIIHRYIRAYIRELHSALAHILAEYTAKMLMLSRGSAQTCTGAIDHGLSRRLHNISLAVNGKVAPRHNLKIREWGGKCLFELIEIKMQEYPGPMGEKIKGQIAASLK